MTKQGRYSQYLFLFSFKQGCENYANDSSHQFCVIRQKEGPCKAGCLVVRNVTANALIVHSKRLFAPWQNRTSPPHFPYSFPAQNVKKYDNHFSHQFCVMNKAGDKRCFHSGLEKMNAHQMRSGFHMDFCFFSRKRNYQSNNTSFCSMTKIMGWIFLPLFPIRSV